MAAPLVKEDLDMINASLKDIKGIREVIIRAKQAGMDVAIQETQIDEAEAKLTATKAAFFPTNRA